MAKLTIIPRGARGYDPFESGKNGFYASVPAHVYHEMDAASSSRLGHLRRSGQHLKQEMAEAHKMTPDMVIGSALHTQILEPEWFDQRFDLADQCVGVKKDMSRCTYNGSVRVEGEWFCKTHAPKDFEPDMLDVLTEDQMTAVKGMAKAIAEHPAAQTLISGQIYEGSILWEDADTGLQCKGRIDNFDTERGAIVDIKTTKDASADAFAKSIYDFGYYRQGAMYLRGMNALGVPLERFVIIAVEKKPPYVVQVFQLAPDTLAAGEAELDYLLPKYKECRDLDDYPGYSNKVEPITVPKWAWDKIYQNIPSGYEVAL